MTNLIGAAQSRRRKRDAADHTIADMERARGRKVTPIHLLFECATGYALFLAKGITEVDLHKLKAVEEYINRSPQPLELKAYLPFSSDHDALVQMDAISKCKDHFGLNHLFRLSYPFYSKLYFVSSVAIVTDKLIKFLLDNTPRPTYSYSIGITDSFMSHQIVSKTGLGCRCSVLFNNVMRGLREKIDQFICLQPGELERAQINLARLHIKQMRTEMDTKSPVVVSSSFSSVQEQVGVVPHRFEGFFNVKGEEDILCTRNLVPGEALYGEKLIHVQNEDRTEVEYRVWDPLRSKLGAAIHHGVTNIWIKPGSRVLYMGNVCGLTVSDLSDLVGLEGLVYVVGLSDDVADMAGKRPNVLTIKAKCDYHYPYRMLVGMVDVIFAEIDHHPEQQFCEEGVFVVNNARYYLRAAGHYMISRKVKVMNSTRRFIFAAHDYAREFKPIETVMLDTEGAYALDVGGYRMRE